jgi:hypothetical protein
LAYCGELEDSTPEPKVSEVFDSIKKIREINSELLLRKDVLEMLGK